MDKRQEKQERETETELTELMQAHLDEVAGGNSHNSWRQHNSPVVSE